MIINSRLFLELLLKMSRNDNSLADSDMVPSGRDRYLAP